MPNNDAFERLLRGTLRRDTAAGACPDPAALAAFSDGTLSMDERRLVESHASSCSRCAAELAMLARTADVPDAAGAAPPQGFQVPWRWAIPLVTAVLVFVVWSETDRPEREAALRTAAPQVEAPAPATRDDGPPGAVAPDTSAPAPGGAPTGSSSAKEAAAPLTRSARKAPPSVAQAPAKTDPDAAFRYEPPEMEDQAAAPTPPPAAAGESSRADEREERHREAPARELPPPAPAPEPMELSKERQSSSPQREIVAGADGAFLLQGPGAVRIRVGPAGIERSADGGTTWRIERAAPSAGVRTGVCATPDVCWLGTDGGSVLRREPAGRWAESHLPTDDAVTAITASDALHATVTTEGARRFSTTDGGRTWSPLP